VILISIKNEPFALLIDIAYYRLVETKISSSIEEAADLLNRGQLVAIPTETVYGLAANALDKIGVVEIFNAKQRPSFDPLIVHIGNKLDVNRYASHIPINALKLMDNFWPGPLTVVLPKQGCIPDEVTSGLDTVAIRMPNHSLTLQLLNQLDFPLAAPSANPFGYISPTTSQHVFDQLQNRIPMILDGGPCDIGLESTIVGFEGELPIVYRLGGLTLEDIRNVCGEIKVAPGMLKSHYAPTKPLKIISSNYNFNDLTNHDALIVFGEFKINTNTLVYNLSPIGNYKEAASNLFSFLRKLDTDDNVKEIFAVLLPSINLGIAINDRLSRAAHQD
jgi:L-threonylcarbamoyladenylate synthase